MPRRAKDAAIALLVLVNVMLLCTVLTYVVALPRAHAQVAPEELTPAQPPVSGPFLAVAGQIQTGSDAQYVLDLNQQQLFVFSPTRTPGNVTTMQLTDRWDMKSEFAKQPTPAIPPRRR